MAEQTRKTNNEKITKNKPHSPNEQTSLTEQTRWKRRLLLLIGVVLLFTPAYDAEAFCFQSAGERYGVSPLLLWSIAKVESGFNHKAINRNADGSYDFGLMQINSSWAATLGKATWNSLSDPCMNVMVGAWVLANCMQKYGNTWEAVGCYNAKSKDKRAKYANKVYQVIQQYTTSKQYAAYTR